MVDQVDHAAHLVLGADRDLGGDDVRRRRPPSASRARAKKSARSRSSMLTKTSRASPSASARRQSRSVLTSTPVTPLTTTTAASATRSAAIASATKLGSPGRVDQVDLAPAVLEAGERGVDRHRPLLLVGLVVGDRRAVGDRAEPVDRAGLEQHRLVQARLAAAPVPDQGDIANPVCGLVRHASEGTPDRRAQPGNTVRLAAGRTSAASPPWCAAARRATR